DDGVELILRGVGVGAKVDGRLTVVAVVDRGLRFVVPRLQAALELGVAAAREPDLAVVEGHEADVTAGVEREPAQTLGVVRILEVRRFAGDATSLRGGFAVEAVVGRRLAVAAGRGP